MLENSKNDLHIEQTIIIDATVEKVTLLFDHAIRSWQQIPALSELGEAQLHLQHELGGQFCAVGKTRAGHYAQELLGTVVALFELELIRIAGPFGSDKCTNGVLTFAFWPLDARTQVRLSYAESQFDKQRGDEWASACQQFLDDLKSRAEVGAGSAEQVGTMPTPALNEIPESAKNASLEEMLALQSHRLQVSQAVPQAVATQKQLEQQLQKNKDQADTWRERAAMAEAQRNPELAVQARQRMEQYSRAAQELQEQLTSHTENTMTLRQHLTEVESKIGCIDPLIAKAANARMSKSQSTDQKSYVPMPGDSLQTQLEGTYQNLQSSLIQLRHAVATAIATEKQLEQQLQKNKDQANTWLERVSMSEQQKNSDLVVQARQRMDQYVRAAGELQEQLLIQKESTSILRQRLTDLESEVQKTYTKKQVLIARDKAANATLKANEALEKTDIPAAIAALTAMETSVIEQEKAASASTTSVVKLHMPIDRQFLADTIATFETAIEAVRQLDQRIADNDKSQKQADLE